MTRAFKFCPACAYRLQAAPLPPPEAPRSNGRWLRALVFLTFGLLVVAIAATGFVVFRPAPPAPPLAPNPEALGGLEGPLAVDDGLLREMVPLERRPAALTPVVLGEGRTAEVEVRTDGYMRILRYEVTRGMYAEYVRDCQANPERIPALLRDLFDPPPVPPRLEPLPVPPNATEAEQREIEAANERASRPHRLAASRRTHGEAYVATWWARLAAHLKDKEGRVVRRPRDLQLPLSPEWQRRILVPPTWVLPTVYEDYDRWALPEMKGRIPENYPVTDVSWYDAEAFAAWASARLDLPADEAFRLPTWTEWMRAGHGGELGFAYPWGPRPLVYACNNLNFWHGAGGSSLRPVDYRYSDGDFGRTPEHLWSMAGNAREWTRNDEWVPVGGNPAEGVPPDYLRVVQPPLGVELLVDQAPTMGGSFDESIGDCTIGLDSLVYRAKWERGTALGFRLYLPGYGAVNPLR